MGCLQRRLTELRTQCNLSASQPSTNRRSNPAENCLSDSTSTSALKTCVLLLARPINGVTRRKQAQEQWQSESATRVFSAGTTGSRERTTTKRVRLLCRRFTDAERRGAKWGATKRPPEQPRRRFSPTVLPGRRSAHSDHCANTDELARATGVPAWNDEHRPGSKPSGRHPRGRPQAGPDEAFGCEHRRGQPLPIRIVREVPGS